MPDEGAHDVQVKWWVGGDERSGEECAERVEDVERGGFRSERDADEQKSE